MKHKAIKVQAKRRKSSIGLVTVLASSLVVSQLSFNLGSASAVGVPSPPTISATLPNGAITSTRTISIQYSGEVGATFSCVAISGGVEQNLPSCPPSPIVFGDTGSALSEGSYTLKIKQTVNGQESLFAETSWTVDITKPSKPNLTSTLRTSTLNSTARFDFSGEFYAQVTNQGFECKLDNGAWEACESPKTYSALAEGAHTFSVKQTDLAGNVSNADTKNWTINTTASAAPTITSSPTSGSNNSGTISFSGIGAIFECKIDQFEFESGCNSPKTYSGLSDGSHTVIIRERDSNGNLSNEAETTWTVDTTAPSIEQRGVPRSPNSQLSLTYTIRFSESISGLSPSDFVVAGGVCQVSSVTLNGSSYQLLLTNCIDKQSVSLSLQANSVADAYGNLGPLQNEDFPTIDINTAFVESIYQAPYVEVSKKTSSTSGLINSRNAQKNEINRTAIRYPLATEVQLIQIEKVETMITKTQKVIASAEQVAVEMEILQSFTAQSSPRQFVTLVTVPVEAEGLVKFLIIKTSVPLLNPYILM